MELEQTTWLGRNRKKAEQATPGPRVLISVRLPSYLYKEAKESGCITTFVLDALMDQQPHSHMKTNFRREKVGAIMDQVASLYTTSSLAPRIQASIFASMKASILDPRGEPISSSL